MSCSRIGSRSSISIILTCTAWKSTSTAAPPSAETRGSMALSAAQKLFAGTLRSKGDVSRSNRSINRSIILTLVAATCSACRARAAGSAVVTASPSSAAPISTTWEKRSSQHQQQEQQQ